MDGKTPRIAWEVVDHGWDGDSYFPGCGVSFTSYTHVATGRGVSARAALTDALECAASDTDAPEAADLDAVRAAVVDGAADIDKEACNGACCEASGEADETRGEALARACDCACHNGDWAYRVSLRWRMLEAVTP